MGKHKWCNDQDVAVILIYYSKNNYRVEMPLNNDNAAWMPKAIKNVINQMNNEGLDCIAIPIILGHLH